MKKKYISPATCAVSIHTGNLMLDMSVNGGSTSPVIDGTSQGGETPDGEDESYWEAWTREENTMW